MKRKKILWISHFLPFPVKSGAQMRSFNLMRQLALYHDVSLVCVVQENVVKNYFSSIDQAIERAHPVFSGFCKNVIFVPQKTRNKYKKFFDLIRSLMSKQSYAAVRLNDKEIHRSLKSAIQILNPDVIHLDTVASGVYHSLFDGVEVVLNHHNIESEMMIRRGKEASTFLLKIICYWDALKIRAMERKLFPIVKTHLVCSDLDKRRFLHIFPDAKIFVVPNGIDCSLPVGDRSPKIGRLLFIGGLDWYPNADAMRFFLKKVWPDLVKLMPTASLDIIGKCPPADLVSLASEETNVKLHGFVDDISNFYSEGWIYICPIMDGGGTKLKVLDAMANKILLVAHPVAVEGIDATPNIHYISASNVQEFISAILSVSEMPRARIEFMESASRDLILEKYDYEKIGRVLSESYV